MQDEKGDSGIPGSERQSLLKATREIAKLPLDQSTAALETSAAIAGVSLRASIEFLRAVPAAAEILQPAELRSWGDIGRRLAMSDAETAISFFTAGVSDLKDLPQSVHPQLFHLCSRQITLSTSIAIETFQRIPTLVVSIADADSLGPILEVAAEIARRSAKHSADFENGAE